MYDFTFGLSATVWIVIAVVCAMLGWGYVNLGLGAGTKKMLKVLAVVGVLIATVALGWWATVPTDTEGSIAATSWDFTHSSGDTTGFSVANNTTISSERGIQITFDSNGGTALDEATINIDYAVVRDDNSVADSVGKLEIISIGSVTNTTTGLSADIIAKTTSGDYDTALDDGSTTWQDTLVMYFPSDPSVRTDTLGVQLEINYQAVANLPVWGSATIVISIDGVTDTISILRIA